MNKSLWLTFAGVVLLKISIFNWLFGFPGNLIESYMARNSPFNTHNSEESVLSDPINLAPDPTFSPTGATAADSDIMQPVMSTPIPSLASRVIESGYVPDRLVIPAIDLDAPVILSAQEAVEVQNQWFEQWVAPDEFAAGWQSDSAPLGVAGNTVLNGHHNTSGKVFGKLVYTRVGDTILVYSGQKVFEYQITEIQVLREKNAPLATRQKNAEWISTTSDERLTLVTCWPKRTNTHRLIVVAYPIESDLASSSITKVQ